MDAMKQEHATPLVKILSAKAQMNNVKKANVSISAKTSPARMLMNIAEEANVCLSMQTITICTICMKLRLTKAKTAANITIAIPQISQTASVTALSVINVPPDAHQMNNV